jgi:PAS domain S-box-containing protein
MKAFAQTGEGGAVGQVLELTAQRKDGTELPVELSLSATRIQGRWHAVGVVRDVSGRRRIQDTLMQQLQRLNALIETLPDPVLYKDRDLRFLGCNQAAVTFLGRERRDIIGKTLDDFTPPHVAARARVMDEALLASGGTQQYEMKVTSADGVERSMLISRAAYRGADGQVAGLAGIMMDLTELRRAEEIARQNEHLESLAVFARGAAHELNNPRRSSRTSPRSSSRSWDPPTSRPWPCITSSRRRIAWARSRGTS